ncbi:MAG: ribonuclease T, partial [Gammaproteobacteria bacterium]|nr:ribonuclease T [Gammaproteobacteria bacterium]
MDNPLTPGSSDSNDASSNEQNTAHAISERFRGYLPVVVDLETGGFNPQTDALLEIAAAPVKMNANGELYCDDTYSYHVKPFAGANIDSAALDFTGIDPYHPLRPAQDEVLVLRD